MNNLLLALIPIALSVSGPSSMKVAKCPLDQLIRFSDAIFVGQVEEVFEIAQPDHLPGGNTAERLRHLPSIPIARVAVQRPLKGVIEGEAVYFLATATWTCDISEAVPGETALFFLNRSNWVEELSSTFRSSLKQRVGAAPTYLIRHAGRGRMPLRTVEGEEYATFWTDVVMPEDLPTVDGPGPEKRSFIRFIHLSSLAERLRKILATQRPYVRAANRTPLSPDRQWQLEVWGDGFGWLSVYDPDRPEYSKVTIEPAALESLKQRLEAVVKAELPATLGQAGPGGPRRLLETDVGDGPVRSLTIHTLFPERLEGESERTRAIAVLELWSELRALFDTERTLDFRPHDEACLGVWR